MDRTGPPVDWRYEDAFDGGEAGCGELLMDLRVYFGGLPPGTHVLVTARDPGAPVEMPAWSRMAGHRLLAAAHPHYLLMTRLSGPSL